MDGTSGAGSPLVLWAETLCGAKLRGAERGGLGRRGPSLLRNELNFNLPRTRTSRWVTGEKGTDSLEAASRALESL